MVSTISLTHLVVRVVLYGSTISLTHLVVRVVSPGS